MRQRNSKSVAWSSKTNKITCNSRITASCLLPLKDAKCSRRNRTVLDVRGVINCLLTTYGPLHLWAECFGVSDRCVSLLFAIVWCSVLNFPSAGAFFGARSDRFGSGQADYRSLHSLTDSFSKNLEYTHAPGLQSRNFLCRLSRIFHEMAICTKKSVTTAQKEWHPSPATDQRKFVKNLINS